MIFLATLMLAAAPAPPARPLPRPGVTVEARLRPGETHVYDAVLARGEFVSLTVNQRGVDVLVTCTGPDGSVLAVHDGPYQRFGPEVVVLLAAVAGNHHVEIRAQEEHAIEGRYVLSVDEWRPSRPEDERRAAAQKSYEDACVLDKKGTRESRTAAVSKYRDALERWKELGDGFHQATTLILLGDVHRDISEHRLAIQEYEEALALVRTRRDRGAEAKTLRKMGTLIRVVGETSRAIPMLEEAARIARQVGDPQTEVSTLRSLGWAWFSVGEYQKSLEFSLRGLEIAQRIQDLFHESEALDEIAKIYDALGDHERAITYGLKAIESARALNHPAITMIAARGLGLLYLSAGRPEKARPCLVESLTIAGALGDRRRRATALSSLGDIDMELGDASTALEDFGSALQLAEEVEFPAAAGAALNGLGRAHAKREDLDGALSLFNRALVVFRRIKDRDGEQHTLAEIARLELRRGRLSESRAAIEAAVSSVESVGARFRNPEIRLYYTASSQPLYSLFVDVQMRQHERDPGAGFDRRAFEMSERGRARALLEALAAAAVEPRASEPLTLAAVQQTLPVGTTLVAYSLTEGGVVVFLVGRDTFRARRLAVSVRELGDRVQNFVDLLSRGDAGALDVGRGLYGDLVGPWRDLLPAGTRRIVFLPDGPLHEMPFEALSPSEAKGGLLLEDFRVSYAPSASVLGRLAAPRAREGSPYPEVMIVAEPERARVRSEAGKIYEDEGFRDTPIPFARVEAERISRYTSRSRVLLLGSEARKTRVVTPGIDRFRVLHFATHAFSSRRFPALSALVLAADETSADAGFLSAGEIYRLRLDSDLVVLSGCQTARGKILGGEGVQGLVSAFLHAGARSVVASLWNVNDAATAGLMESFYRGLAGGLGKAEALRAARLELLHKGMAPRLWAPFVLIGEADEPVVLGAPRA